MNSFALRITLNGKNRHHVSSVSTTRGRRGKHRVNINVKRRTGIRTGRNVTTRLRRGAHRRRISENHNFPINVKRPNIRKGGQRLGNMNGRRHPMRRRLRPRKMSLFHRNNRIGNSNVTMGNRHRHHRRSRRQPAHHVRGRLNHHVRTLFTTPGQRRRMSQSRL